MLLTHNSVCNSGEYGIGNQMFQIASTIGLAHSNNMPYSFNEWHNNKYFKNILPNVPLYNPKTLYQEKSFDYDHIDIEQPVEGYAAVDGYLQSYLYFYECESKIRETFEFNPEYVKSVQDVFRDPELGATCSVSVRRCDYLRLQHIHPVPPDSYWVQAQETMEMFAPVDTYIVFSDDIQWCCDNKELFENTNKKVLFVKGTTPIQDLIGITLCKNHIITNSTFSWWGAWLNQDPWKEIVIPKTWFGPQGPSDGQDLYIPNWRIV